MLRAILPGVLARGNQVRCFSRAPCLRSERRYPSFVHHALKDNTSKADDRKSLPTIRKPILILSPEQTEDKKYNKLLRKFNNKPRRKLHKPDMDFIDENSRGEDSPPSNTPESLSVAIELFRPSAKKVSQVKKTAILHKLSKAFRKSQMQTYIKWKNPDLTGYKGLNKEKLATFIIERVWSTDIKENSDVEDFHITESVSLTALEISLLLLSNGRILNHIQNAVSKIEFDIETYKLMLTGTAEQVENAKINLSQSLENVHKEEIDLSAVRELAMKLHGRFDVEEVGKYTDVCFEHLRDETFDLFALNKNQLKRTKRLVLWLLNYNLHYKEFLHLPKDSSTRMLPFKHDESLAWKDRFKELYVLENQGGKPNQLLLDELEKFSDESLASIDLENDDLFDEENSFAQKDSDGSLDKISDLLGLMGVEDESVKLAPPVEQKTSQVEISEQQRDQIYKELTNFDYKSSLPGVSQENMDPKCFTVTLGNVLFEKPKEPHGVIPQVALVEDHKLVLFNSNITFAHDKLLAMQSDHESSTYKDPHDYRLQFKFTPSPFLQSSDFSNTADAMNYPPIEIWAKVKNNVTPDLDSLHLVSVEGENSSFVCLPQAKSDLKITCQSTGQLLANHDLDNEDSSSASEALLSTSGRYKQLEQQPGVMEFFQSSHLNFSGKRPISIAPTIDIMVNGEKVRYHYLNLFYRREIMFLLPRADGSDLMVDVCVVDGGSLGGKRTEIRFAGSQHGTTRKDFDELLDQVLEFVNTL